jgi:hypothetical protein
MPAGWPTCTHSHYRPGTQKYSESPVGGRSRFYAFDRLHKRISQGTPEDTGCIVPFNGCMWPLHAGWLLAPGPCWVVDWAWLRWRQSHSPMAMLRPLLVLLSAVTAGALDALSWQLSSSFLTTDYDTGVLVATLQGLANRAATTQQQGARPLMVDSFELFNQYYPADRHWVAYLSSRKGLRFTNLTGTGKGDLDGLLESLLPMPGTVNGALLYAGGDGNADEPDGTRYVGLTLCGLEGLLPLTPALRAAHPRLAALPVRRDLRDRFNTSLEAYTWALGTLMGRVKRSVGWSAGRSHRLDDGHFVWQGSPPEMPLLALDMAIKERGFIFNLTPNRTQCLHPARPLLDCRGSPVEAELFDRVMAGLNGSSTASANDDHPLPAIYGWSETESEYTIRVSKGGGYVLCAGAPNLSFWCAICICSPPHVVGRDQHATCGCPDENISLLSQVHACCCVATHRKARLRCRRSSCQQSQHASSAAAQDVPPLSHQYYRDQTSALYRDQTSGLTKIYLCLAMPMPIPMPV